MFRKLKIGVRLALCFGIIIAILVGMEYFALAQFNTISDSVREMYDHPFQVQNAASGLVAGAITLDLISADALRIKSTTSLKTIEDRFMKVEKDLESSISLIMERYLGDKKDIESVQNSLEQLKPLKSRFLSLLASGNAAGALAMHEQDMMPLIESMNAKALTIEAFAAQKALQYRDQVVADSETVKNILRILAAIAILVAVGLSILVSLDMIRPLKKIIAVADAVSAGNLGVELPVDRFKDEIGIMTRSFSGMVTALKDQSRQVSDGVNLLAASSNQISATASQLASASTETASAVSETTVTVEEVKQTAQVSMERARDVAGSAQRTMGIARSAETTVAATVEGMKRIREQMENIARSIMSLSEQGRMIGEIISSVDDIAEQSNLLAVNAAIEAAKAGEQGKGFAVVAREVKILAEGSRQATRQVRSILGDIQKATSTAVMAMEQGNKAVEAGMNQSTDVRDALQSLSAGITESTQMAIQITSANQQQFEGVDQVTQAMENIREASRQNVESARQLEGAARNIDLLSKQLKESMGRYAL